MNYRLIIILLILSFVISVVSADQIAPYGGVLANYTNQSGGTEIQIRTNIPLTVEDVAYPDWLFALMAIAGFAFILYSAVLIATHDTIPSLSMMYCGIIAFGTFAACAVMAPFVASIKTNTDIVASYTGNNTIYIEQTVTYLLSPWVGWACWGMALAGFVVLIAGVLSQFGYLKRRGIGSAQQGEYLETDGDEEREETYHMSAQKENANRRKERNPR